jgi:uncharacterized SAM-binding protein YcdF (DUF218 family)
MVVLLVLFLSRDLWLRTLGNVLVRNDGPSKADIAVLLAGDAWGHRIEKAADMVRQGYVPAVLVDGPAGFYGMHESDAAIAYIVRRGCPQEWFINFPMNARSTEEEAEVVLPELRRRNIHSYLLVTSNFHTARAARTFRAVQRALHYDAQMRVVASNDEDFSPDNWWHTRQGKKAAFIEWCKTFAAAAGQ